MTELVKLDSVVKGEDYPVCFLSVFIFDGPGRWFSARRVGGVVGIREDERGEFFRSVHDLNTMPGVSEGNSLSVHHCQLIMKNRSYRVVGTSTIGVAELRRTGRPRFIDAEMDWNTCAQHEYNGRIFTDPLLSVQSPP